jgi:hypothetical protein
MDHRITRSESEAAHARREISVVKLDIVGLRDEIGDTRYVLSVLKDRVDRIDDTMRVLLAEVRRLRRKAFDADHRQSPSGKSSKTQSGSEGAADSDSRTDPDG